MQTVAKVISASGTVELGISASGSFSAALASFGCGLRTRTVSAALGSEDSVSGSGVRWEARTSTLGISPGESPTKDFVEALGWAAVDLAAEDLAAVVQAEDSASSEGWAAGCGLGELEGWAAGCVCELAGRGCVCDCGCGLAGCGCGLAGLAGRGCGCGCRPSRASRPRLGLDRLELRLWLDGSRLERVWQTEQLELGWQSVQGSQQFFEQAWNSFNQPRVASQAICYIFLQHSSVYGVQVRVHGDEVLDHAESTRPMLLGSVRVRWVHVGPDRSHKMIWISSSLCLLVVSGWTPARGDADVFCVFGKSCILPCSFQGGTDVVLHWINVKGNTIVHSYYNNRDQLAQPGAAFQRQNITVQGADLQKKRLAAADRGGAPVSEVDIQQVGNRITCSSEGIYPEPELTWSTSPPSNVTFNNTATVQQTEQQLYNISSSLIVSDSVTDLVYSCTVSTRTNSRRASLFKAPSASIFSVCGTETTIPCTSSNTTLTKLIWRFNHSQIILIQTRTDRTVSEEWRQQVKDVSESGKLTLQELSSNQEGIYTCELRNEEETKITNTFLRTDNCQASVIVGAVLVGLVIYRKKTRDADVFCVFGKSCILPCSFQGGTDVVLHWITEMRNSIIHSYYSNRDQLAQQEQRFRGRTSLFKEQISRGNASLQLTEVEVQDQGRYKCFTSLVIGNKESFINVKVDAPVTEVNIQQVGNRITCSSEGIYPEPELTWSTSPPSNVTFNNTATVQQTEQQLYNISSSLIVSDSVTDLVYSCTVSTRTNSRRASLFKAPSVFSVCGTETTIPCTSSNTTLTKLIWRFNHSQIILIQTRTDRTVSEEWRQQVKDVSESGKLTLQELSSNQEGIYTCELRNEEETDVTITNLKISKGGNFVFIIAAGYYQASSSQACRGIRVRHKHKCPSVVVLYVLEKQTNWRRNSCILPGSFQGGTDSVILWIKVEGDTVVHSYYNNQDQSIRGRTSLFKEQISRGNASLQLTEVEGNTRNMKTAKTNTERYLVQLGRQGRDKQAQDRNKAGTNSEDDVNGLTKNKERGQSDNKKYLCYLKLLVNPLLQNIKIFCFSAPVGEVDIQQLLSFSVCGTETTIPCTSSNTTLTKLIWRFNHSQIILIQTRTDRTVSEEWRQQGFQPVIVGFIIGVVAASVIVGAVLVGLVIYCKKTRASVIVCGTETTIPCTSSNMTTLTKLIWRFNHSQIILIQTRTDRTVSEEWRQQVAKETQSQTMMGHCGANGETLKGTADGGGEDHEELEKPGFVGWDGDCQVMLTCFCIFGKSCILPCSFQGGTDVVLHWVNVKGDTIVHSYYNNRDQLAHQEQRFRGRTSLFKEQISRGNASLQLTEVEAPVGEVNIQQVGNRITCSSEVIYPEPELTWSTSPPSNVTFNNTATVQQTEQQLYNISSSLIVSDSVTDLIYSCTVSTRTNSRRASLFKAPSIFSVCGTETTIPCTSSNTTLTKLIWRFNHSQIILIQTRTDRTVSEEWRQQVKDVSESGKLTLQELSSNQEGIYTCELRNEEETKITNTFLRTDNCHDTEVSCAPMGSCILPCSFNNNDSVLIHWTTKDIYVHSYYKDKDQLKHQEQRFRGRTSLFKEQISRGNASK
ncbi:hypothetical protein L3Q82_004709 [Scortum barcoo]|uniref:Uncharacterized protein n=1 Tax=Scortum barcoo TaxID=214431 RepID=A0ACB8VH10_9TELE|nr:hypothetical protein L3Q82_004709 [Scortum barcoo]